ncbi:MAG: cobyrinate a,c-diamide synthase [Spirochaetes bacterium]|nr:MAG: cobyrinate a,c-diamide synthase [Spirochaetota bacterium]
MDGHPLNSFRKGIAIAGLRGGSGKTLISLGLLAAFVRRGLSIAPFKKGPDYIDPAWLSLAAGRECHNLDTYLLDERTVISSYLSRNNECTYALVEGNRGLFDGFDIEGTYSFASLAKVLGIPVVIVVDSAKSSRTAAALVRGCQVFDPDLAVRGVILNRVAGERHRSVAAGAIEKYCGIPVLGAVSRIPGLDLSERHLGLFPVQEHPDPRRSIDMVVSAMESAVDIDGIIALMDRYEYPTRSVEAGALSMERHEPETSASAPAVGVIRDSAFNFYYPENLSALTGHGARLVFIDALKDKALPDVGALYIGGGFPETHARALADNESLRNDIRAAVERGLPVYAECGGLEYLSETLEVEGTRYPMAGVFPLRFSLSKKPQGHGYTAFTVDADNPYFPRGTAVRGHEFRYSRLTESPAGIRTAFRMDRGTGLAGGRDGIMHKNVLATFCHTHALGANVAWPGNLVALARERKK